MPIIKNRRQLADEADTLAGSYGCVLYKNTLYLPAHVDTLSWQQQVDASERVWIPLDAKQMTAVARTQFGTMFASPADLESFMYMAKQSAKEHAEECNSLLLRTEDGLRELREDGKLYEPRDIFIPNILPVQLNEDEDDKARVMRVLTEWLNSEEEAVALLRHLATALAPGWSAVKYVLLLGDGRNGKSVLMSMMQTLFGPANVSSVSRQKISEDSPAVSDLNGKLLNIIFDGVAVYLKDSGHEKSLVAGEEIGVRMLYQSTLTTVQTNGLFIEGLNKEPKSSDKSSALQERLVRFWFKNTYEDDLLFKEEMLNARSLGALLSLLLDNYVKREDKAIMLAPTEESKALKIEHMTANSLGMQFIEHLVEKGDPDDLIGMTIQELTDEFRRWRAKDGDIGTWTKDNVRTQFKTVLEFKRKSARKSGKVIKIVLVDGFKKETIELIDSLTEKEETHVVGD
jgi:phage/plasmid-associated DNA primase